MVFLNPFGVESHGSEQENCTQKIAINEKHHTFAWEYHTGSCQCRRLPKELFFDFCSKLIFLNLRSLLGTGGIGRNWGMKKNTAQSTAHAMYVLKIPKFIENGSVVIEIELLSLFFLPSSAARRTRALSSHNLLTEYYKATQDPVDGWKHGFKECSGGFGASKLINPKDFILPSLPDSGFAQ